MLPASRTHGSKAGLAYWANRVLTECDKASHEFAPDPVHDLRVAIRRCRSMADGFLSVDPDPEWKQMKKAGKALFSALGELRDAQVMKEWVERLSAEDDPVRQVLLATLHHKENLSKASAQEALHSFDRKRWSELNAKLAKRTGKVPIEGLVFQHLALERWLEAHDLHRQALRNRTQVGYHQLRIGIKRFRYTVENFLPQRHRKWAPDLRDLQDALGEVHDLDVLRAMLRAHPEIPAVDSARWHGRITEERQKRLDFYRQKMVGKKSLWHVWRADLPTGPRLEKAAMEKLRTWASFLDPGFPRTLYVMRLALQLYDALVQQGVLTFKPEQRRILQAAAMVQEVGQRRGDGGHRKRAYRMVRKVAPPLGWSDEQMHCVAIVARYHRGALLTKGNSYYVGLPAKYRLQLLPIAGILRLANALAASHRERAARIAVERRDGTLIVYGQGVEEIGPAAEQIARARYLLEAACKLPIIVRPFPAKSPVAAHASAPARRRAAGIKLGPAG